jgi:membrane-associated protease RseP (regulator of RpoE activity)
MKLNPHILTTAIVLLTSAAFAAEPEQKTQTSASASNAGSKATITIDVNGHKETREIEFGDEFKIKAGTAPRINVLASTLAHAKSAGPTTWLGVAPEEVSEELRAQLPLESGSGLVVRSVLPDSPAAKAGLQKNDVLMKIQEQLLTNPSQLRTLVAAKKDGDTVRLTYFRRGQQATLDVKLATREEGPADDLKSELSQLPYIGSLFQLQSKAVVVDKDGKVIGGDRMDLDATVEKIAKALRDFGVDEKSISEATRAMTETTKAIRDAISDASAAKEEVQKGSSEIAKALEQVRDAVEKVRMQTEGAVRKEREYRRAEEAVRRERENDREPKKP